MVPAGPLLVALYGAAFLVGCASTVQATLNSQLGAAAGHPIVGAAACYLVGIAFVLPGVTAHAQVAKIPLLRFVNERRPRWFELCGGLLGCCYMAGAVYVTPQLGAALFFALAVVGQLVSATCCDHFAFLGLPLSRLTLAKILALLVAATGVGISSLVGNPSAGSGGGGGGGCTNSTGSATSEAGAWLPSSLVQADAAANATSSGSGSGSDGLPLLSPGTRFLLSAAAIVAGGLQPIQAAVNWRLSMLLPHKVQAVAVSFAVAAVVAVLLSTTIVAGQGDTAAAVGERLGYTPFDLWLGGPLQSLVIAGGVALPARISTLGYYTALLTGELVTGLLVDATGAFGLHRSGVMPSHVAGVLCVLVGTVLLQRAPAVDGWLARFGLPTLFCRRCLGDPLAQAALDAPVLSDAAVLRQKLIALHGGAGGGGETLSGDASSPLLGRSRAGSGIEIALVAAAPSSLRSASIPLVPAAATGTADHTAHATVGLSHSLPPAGMPTALQEQRARAAQVVGLPMRPRGRTGSGMVPEALVGSFKAASSFPAVSGR